MLKDILENANIKLETTKTALTRVRDTKQFTTNMTKVLQTAGSMDLYLKTASAAEANQLMDVSVDAIMRNDIVASLQTVLSQIHEGYLETTSVSSVSRNVTDFKKNLDSLWISAVKSSTEQVILLLKMFGQFMPNENEAISVTDVLDKAKTALPANAKEVAAFASNLRKARQIAEQIGADDEIQAFIQKVLEKQATLADITPSVQAWINNHNITRRLKIRLV